MTMLLKVELCMQVTNHQDFIRMINHTGIVKE